MRKPRCRLSKTKVDLGLISKLTKIDIKLWVENLSREAMHWMVVEITYDPLEKKFYEVLDRIEPYHGVLENCHDKVCFSYKLKTKVNCSVHLLCDSLLYKFILENCCVVFFFNSADKPQNENSN